jgi:uncharacterized radical SAM superfamily Fe-S cluster-containing enzyme
MTYDPRIKSETMLIVQMLVACNYDAIVQHTNGIRLQKDEIVYAVDDYGCTIIMPPESVLDDLDIVEVKNVSPREWSVRCPLWTKEEGRSDLSIEMSMIEENADKLRVELDNIMMF